MSQTPSVSPFLPTALAGKIAVITGGGSGMLNRAKLHWPRSRRLFLAISSFLWRNTLISTSQTGICYEITKQILLHGCSAAIICGRRESFLQKASIALSSLSGKTCLYKVCDVRDPDACNAVVAFAVHNFGRVDILVNGAAGNFLAEAKNLTPKGFRTVSAFDVTTRIAKASRLVSIECFLLFSCRLWK